MEKIKEIVSNEKLQKIALIVLGACTGLYTLVFFFRNCFSTAESKFYNGYFAVILVAMLATTGYLLYLFLTNKEWSFTRVYLILAIGWCVTMELVMPPISGADEVHHFYSAYHASNIMMGIKDNDIDNQTGDWVQDQSYFLMRAEDFNGLVQVDVTFPDQYRILADGDWFHTTDDTNVAINVAPVSSYRYIFSGIGITIARMLNWGYSGVLFMGRFMNSLSMIVIGWLCVRLIPVGKTQVISFALMPTVLELCCSYSYDNMSILFSLLLLSLCLYFGCRDGRLKAIDLFFIAVAFAVLIPNKVVYATFIIWIFAISFKKWWAMLLSKDWKDYALLAAFAAVAVVIVKKLVIKYYWLTVRSILWKFEGATIEQDATRESFTAEYIVLHPKETLAFVWDGIKVDFWYNIKHVIGSELGHVQLNAWIPTALTVILLILLLAGLFLVRGKRIKKWQYVVVALGVLVCITSIFIGCLIRFTPVEGSERVQISYRYLIPAYMALVCAAGTDAKENRMSLALIYIQNTMLMLVSCNLLFYLFHLRDGL